MRRYIVERTCKATVRSEEQNEKAESRGENLWKAESRRENLWDETQLKGL